MSHDAAEKKVEGGQEINDWGSEGSEGNAGFNRDSARLGFDPLKMTERRIWGATRVTGSLD